MSEFNWPKETVVVAESSTPSRKVLAHLLHNQLGFHVVTCPNGQSAWELIRSPECNVICVFADISMPKMDGIELLQKVRRHPAFNELKFVLVTVPSEDEYIPQTDALKVDSYIQRPITIEGLRAIMRELFPTRRFPADAA